MVIKIQSKRVAIIGSGIAGLGAAYLLHPHHSITVYEKNDTVGGHSRTVDVQIENRSIPVDTGFIVFNYRNYPLLTGLFSHLNVPVAKSNMSFGVSINQGWMEYGTQNLTDIFAQKRNILRPHFWRMIKDILRFNAKAVQCLDENKLLNLGDFLQKMRMSSWFENYYLRAMGAAIWSTPLAQMNNFPASSFIRFFENHGLLTVTDQPQWYTVEGGSREYVKRLIAPFKERIKTGVGAVRVAREEGRVLITDNRGETVSYDEVVFACHADQALEMIDKTTKEEQDFLSAFKYQKNRAVLHSDIKFMPKRKKAWSSWVYLSEEKQDQSPHVSLSYWMNNLQPLNTSHPLIVTLNPHKEPDFIHDNQWFEHPVFDEGAIRAQGDLAGIQGKNRFWFCGAYQRYGFHEDGLASAVNMAQAMGINKQWK